VQLRIAEAEASEHAENLRSTEEYKKSDCEDFYSLLTAIGLMPGGSVNKDHTVNRGWRKLHNEELHNLYSFPSIIRIIKSRRMRWAGYVARMGEKRNAYRILVVKPEGKRPLGRPRRRWVDNIKMDLRVIGWDGVD
jgi:hypothetical protein